MNTTIVMADDHTEIRASFRGLLDAQDGLEVIGEAADGEQAVQMARLLSPDVIVMDINMPVMNGIEALKIIIADNPSAKVVVLSMLAGSVAIETLLRAGARGYVTKPAAWNHLVKAVRAVAAGGIYVSSRR